MPCSAGVCHSMRVAFLAMANGKKSFVLYCDQRGLFDKLPDEIAGKLIKHIFSYVNDEHPESQDMLIEIAFESIKTQLKRDLKKWESRAEASRTNGLKGGRPKKPKETYKTQQVNSEPRKPVNDNVNVNVSVNDNNYNGYTSADAELRPTFDEFWDAYDYKIDKRKAESAWKKVAQKNREKIMLHLRDYVPNTNKGNKFPSRRHPTTYLNNQTWESEVPKAEGKNSKKKQLSREFEQYIIETHGTH